MGRPHHAGTQLNRRWIAQLDVVAGFLRQLHDARIPVLWRPTTR